MNFKIKKGLDLPISGTPLQQISQVPPVKSVALLGSDYKEMKPTMLVAEGDRVKLGQALFTDKRAAGVVYSSPGCGIVESINRGARRFLQSVVIRLDGDEAEEFNSWESAELKDLDRNQVEANLVKSGQWTAFRTRPYSRVPVPGDVPHSIFVTAIDSNPLCADPALIIREQADAFVDGLEVIKKLTDGRVYLCQGTGSDIPGEEDRQLLKAYFSGPHPSGLAGTHIHLLDPVHGGKTVWHVGYQDVIAIGRLFTSGRLWTERVIALAGPLVRQPRLIRTRSGAHIEDLVGNELAQSVCRIISGSVLNGHHAHDWSSYLGRYHNQVSVIAENREREFFGWLKPGMNKFSNTNIFLSSLFRRRDFAFTTAQNGSPRAMFPLGGFERVVPLDIMPTQLLRALLVRDTETAQDLGCMELDEEDLALCSFVCCSKYDYGLFLRDNLELIEREG